MKKNEWIAARVKELVSSGVSQEAAIAQAYVTVEKFQQGGPFYGEPAYPITSPPKLTPEQERLSIAPQRPIKHIQKVQTTEYKGNGQLAPGEYHKVYYVDPNHAKVENQDYEYVNSGGYTDLQRMSNYRVYMENLQKKPAEMTQGASVAALPAFQRGGQWPAVDSAGTLEDYQRRAMGDMYMAANQPAEAALPGTTALPAVQQGANGFTYDPTIVDPNNKPSDYQISPKDNLAVTNTGQNENFDRFNLFNPYGGVDIPTAAYTLGKGIQNKNGLETVGSALKLATGLGRNFLSGMSTAKVNNYVDAEYKHKMQDFLDKPQYMQKGGEVTNADVLTGAYLTDQSNPNAEIENKEHVMHGDTGTVQEAAGETHEEGGIPVNLADGSKVLSDFTKIGGENARQFRKTFDVDVKASDTFAKVLDRVNRKIGLKKKLEEEKDLILQVEKQEKGGIDKTTKELNMSFLSKKLEEIQIQKAPLEEAQKSAFETIFKEQEKIPKKQDEKEVVHNSQEEEREKMQAGGAFFTPSRYAKDQYGNQHYGSLSEDGIISGDVTDIGVAGQRLRDQYGALPNTWSAAGIKLENGTPQFTGMEKIGDFQKNYDTYVNSTIAEINANPYMTAEEKKKNTEIAKQQLLGISKKKGTYDAIYGDETSSRSGFTLPYLKDEDRKKYPGLRRIGDAVDDKGQLKPEYKDLDPATRDLIQGTYKRQGKNSLDIGLGDIPTQPAKAETPGIIDNTGSEVVKGVVPLFPEAYNPFPTPLQGVYKGDINLPRIEPTKISAEPNLTEIERQRTAANGMNANLPTGQAVANNYATLVASNQAGNQAISNAEMFNADAVNKADIYNAGAKGKEDLTNLSNALSYEQRILKGKANSETELQDYFSQNNAQQLQNYRDVASLNLLNAGFDNYQTDGSNVYFNNASPNLVSGAKPVFNQEYFLKLNAAGRKDYMKSLGMV